VLWAGLVAWVGGTLPSLVPVLSPEHTLDWADRFSDVPVLAVVLLAALLRLRVAPRHAERTFWRLMAGCPVGWLAVRALYIVIPVEHWGIGVDLASDLFYLAGYLCVALALERRPDGPPGQGQAEAGRRMESLGTLIFAFGLLAYFVLVPSVFNPEIYASWVSSLLLYAVLDAFLLTRAVTLLRTDLAEDWRVPMGWLTATLAIWFVGDMTEGLMYLEILPWVDPGHPVDVLWQAPALTLLLTVRSRSWQAGATAEAPRRPVA